MNHETHSSSPTQANEKALPSSPLCVHRVSVVPIFDHRDAMNTEIHFLNPNQP